MVRDRAGAGLVGRPEVYRRHAVLRAASLAAARPVACGQWCARGSDALMGKRSTPSSGVGGGAAAQRFSRTPQVKSARLLARPSLLPPDTMRATAARTGGAATCGWQQGEVRGDTREKARAADQTDDCLCTPFERAGGALATLLLGRRPARCWRGRGVLWTRADHQSGCLIGCTPLMPNCTEFILTSAPLAIVLPHRVSSRDAALHLEGWWRASK